MKLRQIKSITAAKFTVLLILFGTLLSFSLENLISLSVNYLYTHLPNDFQAFPFQFGIILISLFTAAGIFYWIAVLAFRYSGQILNSTARMVRSDHQTNLRYFIMGYSLQDEETRALAQQELELYHLEHVAKEQPDYETSRLDKDPDKMPKNRANKWQQNLRLLSKHKDTLEKIYVLPPRENKEEEEQFKLYLKTALGKDSPIVEFICGEDGEPFYKSNKPSTPFYEDYNYIFAGVARGMEMAREQHPNAQASEICVDATSGTKTFSIAAGIATLNAASVFSYVTNGGQPLFYNASVEIGQQP